MLHHPEGLMPFWGSLPLEVSLGTLSLCGHYGMHLPPGIPCITVKGSVSGRGVCLYGVPVVWAPSIPLSLGFLCHQRLRSSWGCFCVVMGTSVIGVHWGSV